MCVWPPCCDMLAVVGSCLKMVTFEPTTPNMSQQGGQTHTTYCTQQCCDMLSPGQTIATCQLNISQHCWVQYVVCVWPPCCDMLGVVDPNLTIFKLEPTTPNMSQHIATWWPNEHNMLRPTVLRYVALTCCDRLDGAL